MKLRYRLFKRRGRTFYCFDNDTQRYTSLHTRDRDAARQIVEAKNLALRHPMLSRQIGKAYLASGDPKITSRTWQHALDTLIATKQGPTRDRWVRAAKEHPFDRIRHRVIIDTQAEHFLQMLQEGTVSTNVHLRKLHNFCLDMNWLPVSVLPKKQWPKIVFKQKRAITLEEHQRILQAATNAEQRAFYALAWEFGASQSDLATLCAENICWETRTLSYRRHKTGTRALLHLGGAASQILQSRPTSGLLFPRLAQMDERHRATEFQRLCRGLNIHGVSLHSYRYAWAERALKAAYPERFAQEALGHNSKAVHHAYAKRALVQIPSLEDYERQAVPGNIVRLNLASAKDTPVEREKGQS